MIDQFFLARYPGDGSEQIKVREFLRWLCTQHIKLGLADPNFESNLCGGDEPRYWQRLSEALLAYELLDAGLDVRPSRNGPDFLVMHDGRKIWVEVICPEPLGIPEEWLSFEPNLVVSGVPFPDKAILLRWTAAIKEKAEKLLGNSESPASGYLKRGVVGPDDSYVIAINGRRLRGKNSALMGISGYPFAVEAVFEVGPYQLEIDPTSLKITDAAHQLRPCIAKPKGCSVPAYTFLDPAFRAVSAIWATDINDCWVLGNDKPMAVVHNPIAINPIPQQFLPATWEYVPVPSGKDKCRLDKRQGRLSITA